MHILYHIHPSKTRAVIHRQILQKRAKKYNLMITTYKLYGLPPEEVKIIEGE